MKSSLLQSNVDFSERDLSHLVVGPMEASALTFMAAAIHYGNVKAGWWTNILTKEPLDRNAGELMMLMVSEIAEGMEGDRKDKQDDHLPQYKMVDVEMADAFIRIMDFCGARACPIGEIVLAKLHYNANRADHKQENRLKADGKKY